MQNRERKYSSSFNHVLIGVIIIFIIIPIESKKRNDDDDDFGFSTELIHIDSPLSPFSNLNLTTFDYLLNNHTNEIGSSLLYDRGLYLMEISYGTPKVKYYNIIDTGSELSWMQCLPCIHCYQSQYQPLNPNNSKTFRFEKSCRNETCPYNITYADNSRSRGDLARETITLGSGFFKTKFENFLFGCGHENVGDFPHKSGGLVGLNLQERSFITQLRSKHRGKFSYCMAPRASSQAGKISFGSNAIVSGGENDVMTTPLILSSHYVVLLDAITVGTRRIKYFSDSKFSTNSSNDQLRLMIDTGANSIYVSNSFYSEVESRVKKFIKTKSPIGASGVHRLCYPSTLKDSEIPEIKLHFPGVILELNPFNSFALRPGATRCLSILPTNGSFILGNLAQINFLVAYNLVEKKVSFRPTNCARL